MERVEKILLLAVLGVAVMIVAVMSFLPEEVKAEQRPVTGVDPAKTGEQRPSLQELMGHSAPEQRAPEQRAPEQEAPEQEAPKQGARREGAPEQGTPIAKAPEQAPGVLEPVAKESDVGKPAEGGVEPAIQKGATARVAMQYAKNPEYLQYVVRSGDTLGQIVADVCGTSLAIDDVLSVNEELRTNPHLIAPGYRLLIPKFAIRPETERPPKAAPRTKVDQRAPPAAKRFYTVQDGDSLWKIAAGIVGKGKAAGYVGKLQELNPKALGTLRVGTRLRLPR